MTSLTFRVPFTALCSDNRKYLGGGTFVLSPEYRAAKGAMNEAAWVAAKRARWQMPTGPVLLMVAVTEPDHRKRDFNWTKQVMDGITASGAVWHDDSQVRQMFWYFVGVDKANAGAEITIVTLPDGGGEAA